MNNVVILLLIFGQIRTNPDIYLMKTQHAGSNYFYFFSLLTSASTS